MLRWGILGAGGIAAKVGADIAASAGSTVSAVGARDVGRAQALASRLGAPRAYGSYAELVNDPEVDVVYISTVHSRHHEQALLALRAGKPVLVEKAFTLNAPDAREVIAEAGQRELFCMEAMWLRCHPLIRRAVAEVEAGRIGEVIGVRADLSVGFPFDPAHRIYDLDQGGGGLLDLGVYPATFAWLFLGRPETNTTTGTLSPAGSDSTAAMQWSYPDGRFAHVACSTRAYNPFAGLVTGTEGWLEVGPRVHHPTLLRFHDGTEFQDEPIGNGYNHQVAEVERCLAAGRLESPLVPWADTIATLETLDDARAQLGVRYPGE